MRLARPDPEYLLKLEAQAARNPAAYRFKVVVLALWGDVTLTAAQLLPIVLPIALVLFVLNAALVAGSLAILNWAGVAAMVLLVWLTRPIHRFDGTEIKPEQAPEFFRTIDALREKLSVSSRLRVLVDDDFNASAAETRGALGFLGRQQTLTLGIPLLCVLSREQMLAVIGHELGHFSRRHGRFGHWLYRARGGWMLYAQDVLESGTIFERAAAGFAQRFVPYFSACSFVLARQCEYEADADAASVTSADAISQALTRLGIYGRLWYGGFRRETNRWRLNNTDVPQDYLQRFMQVWPRWPEPDVARWLRQALAEKPDWIDTHPRLPERVAALGKHATAGDLQGPCAGEALFGEQWGSIMQAFNQRWAKLVERQWLFRHLYRKSVLQPLLQMNPAQASAQPVSAQLLRAEAVMDDDPEQGRLLLMALAAQHADDAEVSLRAGLMLGEWEPALAMSLLQRAATLDPTYRAQSFQGLRALHETGGNGKEADRYTARWEFAVKHAERAGLALDEALVNGDVTASVFDVTAKSLMASAAQADACVAELWWFTRAIEVSLQRAGGVQRSVKYPMQFGLWVIDPEIMRQAGENEDHVAERYTGYLQTLLSSNVLVAGKAIYTTENRDRWVVDLMARLPQACCFKRV